MNLERKETVACMKAQLHFLDSLKGLYKRHILMPLDLEILILILRDAHLHKENLLICYHVCLIFVTARRHTAKL